MYAPCYTKYIFMLILGSNRQSNRRFIKHAEETKTLKYPVHFISVLEN